MIQLKMKILSFIHPHVIPDIIWVGLATYSVLWEKSCLDSSTSEVLNRKLPVITRH